MNAQTRYTDISIVPESDVYYLSSWNLEGNVKSIDIRSHVPRNPAVRFPQLEECRSSAKSGEKFFIKEERYEFNKKGLLLKQIQFTDHGKVITVYGYNRFDKIASIECGEKRMLFLYDINGVLVRSESYRGAKMDMIWLRESGKDSTLTITQDLYSGVSDTLIEKFNKDGKLIYNRHKTRTHDVHEDFMEYDAAGRMYKTWNSLGMYFEYEFDERNRIVKTYVGRDKEFMAHSEYDDINGVVKTTRLELVNGNYLPRNFECRCTAIDGQNNPVKCELIDCNEITNQTFFTLDKFFEITYDYFK